MEHRSIQSSGIILAGGSSSRMGKNKALLSHPGNQAVTFVEYLASLLVECCSETLIVASEKPYISSYPFPGVRVTFDKTPGIGPLMGLYSGLSAITNERALVVAVDLPCIQLALLTFLLSQPLSTDSLLVPLVHNVPQVLLAIYPRSVLPVIEEQLRQGRRDLHCLLEVAPVQLIEEAQLRQVDPQLRSFVNINTPEELQQMLQTEPASLGN
jgi:molybdopterin-guanine dinucleotide biosynthesis protein A